MERTLWAVFFAALLLAASLLAGCGQKEGSLGSFEWAIEPQYEFEKVEPVVDAGAMREGAVCLRAGEAGYYLAKTARGWGVLNAATGGLVLEGVFPHEPYHCGFGHLYGPDAQYSYEQAAAYNTQLAALGSTFEIEVGHGGVTCQYLLEPNKKIVCLVTTDDNSPGYVPVVETDKAFPGLLPVAKGKWQENEMWGGMGLGRQLDSLYAVASQKGELLTDFVYEHACMPGPELIAVQKKGKWGYVNREGKETIPCEYDGFWGAQWQWSEEAQALVCQEANYPAPCTEGCVVVKTGGETGVLRADGSVLLAFGEVEEAAPAHGDLLWVRTGGKWGALRLEGRAGQ